MEDRRVEIGAVSGKVAKKKRRPGWAAHMDEKESLIDVAAGPASSGGRKSSQGLARDMTEMSMLWVFMKWSFWSRLEKCRVRGRPGRTEGILPSC